MFHFKCKGSPTIVGTPLVNLIQIASQLFKFYFQFFSWQVWTLGDPIALIIDHKSTPH